MEKSRRDVVIGGLAAATVAVPALAAVTAKTSVISLITAKPTPKPVQTERQWWEAMVGKTFNIKTETGSITSTLVAIERIPFDPGRPQTLARSEPFIATFTGTTRNAPLGQNTYPMNTPGQGIFNAFLSRGTDRGDQAVLTALFN